MAGLASYYLNYSRASAFAVTSVGPFDLRSMMLQSMS